MPYKELLLKNFDLLQLKTVSLNDDVVQKLQQFTKMLLENTSRRSVTSLDNPEDVVRELIIDSLGSADLFPDSGYAADLGSGGGVPGIPLAIVKPGFKFVLVESNNRKCEWLNQCIEELGLKDKVTVACQRIEDTGWDKQFRASFDIVTAKALSSLPSLVELSLPLLKVGGHLLAYKGIKAPQEIADSDNALKQLKGAIEKQHSYQLDDRQRVIVSVKKLDKTSKLYPRRVGLAQHNPL